jgi:hypothetical protein
MGVRRSPHGGLDLLGEVATWFGRRTDVLSCQVDKSSFTVEARVYLSNPSMDLEEQNNGGNASGDLKGAMFKKRKRRQDGLREALPDVMPGGLQTRPCVPREGTRSFQSSDDVTDDAHLVIEESQPKSVPNVHYVVRVTVLQDSPGSFVVRGSIPASSSELVATHFSILAANLQAQIGSKQA